jgi:hypothetical protein
MKGTFQGDDYLFFFEDLIENKGSLASLFEAGNLFKV